MFSRRHSARQNRNRITGSSKFLLHTVFSSVPVLRSVQSNVGISSSGANVVAWNDVSGNGKHFAQAVPANQFGLLTNVLNGKPVLQSVAGASVMASTLTRGAVASNPTTILGIIRIDAWHAIGANDVIWSDGGCGLTLITDAAGTPNLHSQCSTPGGANNGAAVGSWVRVVQYADSTASSYLKLGSVKVSGASGTNSVMSPNSVLGLAIAGRTIAFSIATQTVLAGLPTDSELAKYDAAALALFGNQVGF